MLYGVDTNEYRMPVLVIPAVSTARTLCVKANLIKTVIENIYSVKDIDAALAVKDDLLKTSITTTLDPETATPIDDYNYIQEFDSDFTT